MTPVVAKYHEILAQITNGARWFSVLDLSNAFFSIPLEQASWYKFAFTYKDQQYTFTRVPQGFHNAPTICHRAVSALWKTLKYASNVISYVDDVLIATKDRDTHLKALEEVLSTLKQAGFLVNPSKAQLLQKRVVYLGVELGEEGRKPNHERVKLIAGLPAPTDVHTLRMFLGLLGFSRDFIEDFGLKAKPLYKLLKKSQEWSWGEKEQKAFVSLKTALMQAPALAYPDPSREFHLQLSTGPEAIGAVLLQKHGTSIKPIAYGSRTISEVEQQYNSCEKEVLALVWSLQHWEYIIGMAPVILKTCHTPVRYILSGRANNGRVSHPRIAQWTLSLMNHPVKIEPSKTYNLAPALLCQPLPVEKDHECPIPDVSMHLESSPFILLEKYEAIKEYTPDHIWVVDGSCHRNEGQLSAGAAALHTKSHKEILRPIQVISAQAAEIIGVILALENSAPTEDITICTDSEWVLRAFVDWMSIWKERGMCSTNGKPVA
uniref:ribonuclease H n=1 Tax=Pelodiscus sinensis TaxID=13735 RepID=K7EZC3_PELSI